jgi:hypothetical protein
LVGNGRIYVFKGRTSWNATYSADIDADYIIELDSTYTGKFFGASITRLGDFNGDGVDDFAVGCTGYNGGRGRVVVILGKAGFSAASVNIQTIDGDPAYPAAGFGGSILGLGKFYTGTAGTSLIASATTAVATNRGQVYAFHGRAGSSGSIDATMADNSVPGAADGMFYGTSLALVGAVGGVPGVAIGAGASTPFGAGIVDLYYGSPAAGPFGGSTWRFTDSKAMGTDLFGRVILGSAFAGTAITVSIIGDTKPDLIMLPNTESTTMVGPTRAYIVDGSRFSAIISPADVVTNADVVVPLPGDWKNLPLQRSGMIKDLDGDGYGDFAIGESIPTGTGRLAVFW